jgi:hypothetical protein
LWYYFRAGYVNYDSLGLSLFSNFIVIYKLGLVQIPFFQNLFPHLLDFLVIAALASIPLNVGLGAFHASRKRGPLNAEIEVGMLTNPFMYKAIPGKELLVNLPIQLITIDFLEEYFKDKGTLTQERKDALEQYRKLTVSLLKGEEVRA